MAKSPGQLLDELLEREEIEKTDLGRRLGTTYLTVNRWTKDQGFGEENQQRAAIALGLPANYFAKPDEAAELEQKRAAVFAAFLEDARKLGYVLTENERRTLAGIRFFDAPPTTSLYMAWFLSLRGHVQPKDVAQVAAENAELAQGLAKKGDPFVRKSR